MNPGDTIEVEDGSYNLSSLTINRSGCQLKPILIKAKNQGQAILNGNTALVLDGLKYVTIQGFSFQSTSVGTGIKILNCSRVRITRNSFALTETSSCNWVYIGDTFGSTEPIKSGHNKVDYNVFNGKTQSGKYVLLDGNINQQSQYDTISYNLFKNNGPRAANEKESIRIGVSTLSKSYGYTVVEHNLFEDCDGDPEIVSVKSYGNTIRYNTFVRCLGTVCLRQGNGSVVEGNHFFGDGKTAIYTVDNGDGTSSSSTIGCGGVRIYGKDHRVINNYFHELTGSKWDAAITLTNGDVTNSSTSTSDHFLPENITVAFNTFVNNNSNIEIGFDNNGKYPKSPINCLIANNVVVSNANAIVKSYSSASLAGVSFSNNLMYPTGTSSVGISYTSSQIKIANPLLVQPACTAPDNSCNQRNAYKVFRLSAGSPAIDAATGSFDDITSDFEKQSRAGTKDIGADEYHGNDPIYFSALSEDNVGPDALPFNYAYAYSTVLPVTLLNFSASAEMQSAKISWQVVQQTNVLRYEVEWSTDGKTFTRIASVPATSFSTQQTYSVTHQDPLNGNNYYRLKMVDADGKSTYSSIESLSVAGSVSVYPNPASNAVKVKFGKNTTATLQLVNTAGVIAKELKAQNESIKEIPVQDLADGIYYLKVSEPAAAVKSFPIIIVH